MAAITAAMVKELRESTGAGMMECKKALTETDGDMEAAVDVLRKSGAAKVEKKAGRIAAEGITRVASEGNTAVVVEVNSETDFVAKNATFQEFVQAVADKHLRLQLIRLEMAKMYALSLICSQNLKRRLLQSVRSFLSEDSRRLQVTV